MQGGLSDLRSYCGLLYFLVVIHLSFRMPVIFFAKKEEKHRG